MKIKRKLQILFLNIFLIIAIVTGSLCLWLVEIGVFYDSFNSSTIDVAQLNVNEDIGAFMLYTMETEGWDKLNLYCSQNHISYAIYTVQGRPVGSNMTAAFENDVSELLARSRFNHYSPDNEHYFKGIEDYEVRMLFGSLGVYIQPEAAVAQKIIRMQLLVDNIRWVLAAFIISTILTITIFISFFIGIAKEKPVVPIQRDFLLYLYVIVCLIVAFSGRLHDVMFTAADYRNRILLWMAVNVLLHYAVKLQSVGWHRTTIAFHVYQKIQNINANFVNAAKNAKVLYVCVAGLVLLTGLELFGWNMFVMVTEQNRTVALAFQILLVLEKVVLLLLAVKTLGKLQVLLDVSDEIRGGHLDCKLDPEEFPVILKKLAENMGEMGESVNEAVTDRMKSEHLKTELITNVSHDLKTPLTSIINFSDLISMEHTDNPKITEYSEHLTTQATRLKKLMDDLIEASKASTGNIDVNLAPCDVRVLLGQCKGEFEPRLEEKNIELVVKSCKEPAHIMADCKLLCRVFENLLNNICKYALENTRVYISTEINAGKVRIAFKNISKYSLDDIAAENLMERFVRGDMSRHSEGHGLGLSIVKSLMDLQQGKVELAVDGDLFKVILEFDLIIPDEYTL